MSDEPRKSYWPVSNEDEGGKPSEFRHKTHAELVEILAGHLGVLYGPENVYQGVRKKQKPKKNKRD